MQIVLTIFYLMWLIAVLVFLFLIYRWIRSYVQRAEKTTLQSSELSAQAALKSAEAAAKLAEMLEAKEAHNA